MGARPVPRDVFERAHADLQPHGFAGAALYKLAPLLQMPEPVASLAARVVEDSDPSAILILHDALMEADQPEARILRIDKLADYWQTAKALAWQKLPVCWGVCVLQDSRRPNWTISDFLYNDWERWPHWRAVVSPKTYDPRSDRVVRFRSREDAQSFCDARAREWGTRSVGFWSWPYFPVPLRGEPNIGPPPDGVFDLPEKEHEY